MALSSSSTATKTTTVNGRSKTNNSRRKRQVCLFGTSANPPTGDGGHAGIVKALSTELDDLFDEIRVLPVYQHSFSSKRHQLAPYEHRMNMARIAFGDIRKATVSDAEKELFERIRSSHTTTEEEKISLRIGTADLLEMLIEQEPETDFTFCLGADTFMDLTAWKWKRSRDVFRLLNGRIVVLHRKGIYADLQGRIDSIMMTTTSRQQQQQQRHQQDEGEDDSDDLVLAANNIKILDVPGLEEVSSSSVRTCEDEQELDNMVSPRVLDYIKTNSLYAFQDKMQN